MVDEVSAWLDSKQELDAIAIIGLIRTILAQPRADRNLDAYAELMRQLCKARHAVLVELGERLEIRARAPVAHAWPVDLTPTQADALVPRAVRAGFAHELMKDAAKQDCLIVLVKAYGEANIFLALELAPFDRNRVNEVVMRCLLAADLSERATGSGEAPDGPLFDMLGLVTDVVHQPEFRAAALSLVNGMVSRFGFSLVALVQVSSAKACLSALSHLDRFDRGSDFVKHLETAALEVLKQGRQLSWHDAKAWLQLGAVADAGDAGTSALALMPSSTRMLALPMHDESGAVKFVVLLASDQADIAQDRVDRIQFGLDILEPRMEDLHQHQRAWIKRVLERSQRWARTWMGPGHLAVKAGGIAAFIVLFASLVVEWPYRVEATAEITTDATRVISAQFDGHIDQVMATAGDAVEASTVLATLDRRDLIQQRLENENDLKRFEAESSKALAANALADAQISVARIDQAKARIEQFNYLLSQADCVAPFKGVVVEGERKDLLNAPVKKGERIFKIARVEGLYLNLYVSERDMRDVVVGASGTAALLSRPDQHIAFHLLSINPVGQVKGQEGNLFQIRAAIDQNPESWWRPGMTGAAKVDSGKKQIFWLVTHRVFDFLRMKFMV